MDSSATLVDISEEEETQVKDDSSSAPVPAVPITSSNPSLPFQFPPVTPWPLPLPPQHPGLRTAAEKANAGMIFKLWDSLARTELAQVSDDSPCVISIITVDNDAWNKIAQNGEC
jgi:hypothetical protein